jgi:hypothetical protein
MVCNAIPAIRRLRDPFGVEYILIHHPGCRSLGLPNPGLGSCAPSGRDEGGMFLAHG